MNPKLEEFIAKKRCENKEKGVSARNAHLLELGLLDETKTTREFVGYDIAGAELDKESGRYYIETPGPMEVSDEEYDLICSLCKKPKQKLNIDDENTLNTVAIVILIAGIIGAIILFFATAVITVPRGEYGHSTETVFSWPGAVTAFSTLLASIVTWSVLRVISNISRSLKERD